MIVCICIVLGKLLIQALITNSNNKKTILPRELKFANSKEFFYRA